MHPPTPLARPLLLPSPTIPSANVCYPPQVMAPLRAVTCTPRTVAKTYLPRITITRPLAIPAPVLLPALVHSQNNHARAIPTGETKYTPGPL